MTTATLNLNKAATLNIDNVYSGHSWKVIIDKFNGSNDTPEDFTGTYTFILCKDVERKKIVAQLTVGNGLTITTNRPTIFWKKNINIPLETGTYFYDLHDDIDTENSFPFLRGELSILPSR